MTEQRSIRTPLRRILKISIITILALTASWFLLPPILDNTPLVKAPLESYLSSQFDAPVKLGQFAFTTWKGALDMSISSMDILAPETNKYLVQCDDIRLKILPWQLVFGSRRTKRLHVGRIEVSSPLEKAEKYLNMRGYISKSLLNSGSPVPSDTDLVFKDIDMEIKSKGEEWIAGAQGNCDLGIADNSRFQTAMILNPRTRQIRLNPLILKGTRRITQHFIDMNTGELVEQKHATPMCLTVSGRISPHEVILPHINLTIDTCQILSQVHVVSNNLNFSLDINRQTLTNLGRIFRTRSPNNSLEGIDVHIKSHTKNDDGILVTKGFFGVEKGMIQNLAFSDGMLTINMINDRLTALMYNGMVWNGHSHITLYEEDGIEGEEGSATNKILHGILATRNIDLNAFLNRFDTVPARSGGEINMNYTFELDNTGISEFLADRSQILNRMRGEGQVSISNCYLGYFLTDSWQLSDKIPELLKNYLGLAANLTGTGLSMPVIRQLLKNLNIKMPREITTSIAIDEGVLSTPELSAKTPLGIISGSGICESDGALDYRVAIELKEDLMKQYGDHPLLLFFMEDERILLPIRLTGKLSRPRVELDMTDEEREEFEEEAIKIITAFVQKKLTGKSPGEENPENMKQMEKTVRSIIRKLLY